MARIVDAYCFKQLELYEELTKLEAEYLQHLQKAIAERQIKEAEEYHSKAQEARERARVQAGIMGRAIYSKVKSGMADIIKLDRGSESQVNRCYECWSRPELVRNLSNAGFSYECKCGNKGIISPSISTARGAWNYHNPDRPPTKAEAEREEEIQEAIKEHFRAGGVSVAYMLELRRL